MGRLFGTDGARGVAISEITVDKAMLIGKAAALTLSKTANHKPKILIGKDTRISGDILEAALIAGICSVGADVHLLGVIPTPAVAYLTVKYGADAGVVISASHNSYEFNGIKLFSSTGYKLPDEVENEIERLVLDAQDEIINADCDTIGHIYTEKNAEWDYVRYLIKQIDTDLGRMKIAIDCANGAASSTAEKFFRGINANVTFLNNTPDGFNINRNCGSTDLSMLSKYVVENRCVAGIAFDGDADRCLVVDEKGELVDGDKLIALLALDMKENEKLASNTCVVTQMTNLGFFRWAKENGIVVSTSSKIGDRYVLERMLIGGYNLGGEQSGHIILSDIATTGDGELSGAKILEILAKSGKKMSDLANVFTPYPQLLLNVKLRDGAKGTWKTDSDIEEMINYCSERLGSDGRIFVRESGTEPLLRIMVEGRDAEAIYNYAHAIAKVVEDKLGELNSENC